MTTAVIETKTVAARKAPTAAAATVCAAAPSAAVQQAMNSLLAKAPAAIDNYKTKHASNGRVHVLTVKGTRGYQVDEKSLAVQPLPMDWVTDGKGTYATEVKRLLGIEFSTDVWRDARIFILKAIEHNAGTGRVPLFAIVTADFTEGAPHLQQSSEYRPFLVTAYTEG
jgi:hypothetical protein